jgi:hypothetical protein
MKSMESYGTQMFKSRQRKRDIQKGIRNGQRDKREPVVLETK